jgi:hypothetical protein
VYVTGAVTANRSILGPARDRARRSRLIALSVGYLRVTTKEVTRMAAWVWILIIVLIVLLLFGGVGYSRR